jgi:class 3 adenylate cyclase
MAMPREPTTSDSDAGQAHRSAPGSQAERPNSATSFEARSMPTHRRLAAVLVADVAGYSRLMGAYEERTLDRLITIRAEVIDPTIATNHGRLERPQGMVC